MTEGRAPLANEPGDAGDADADDANDLGEGVGQDHRAADREAEAQEADEGFTIEAKEDETRPKPELERGRRRELREGRGEGDGDDDGEGDGRRHYDRNTNAMSPTCPAGDDNVVLDDDRDDGDYDAIRSGNFDPVVYAIGNDKPSDDDDSLKFGHANHIDDFRLSSHPSESKGVHHVEDEEAAKDAGVGVSIESESGRGDAGLNLDRGVVLGWADDAGDSWGGENDIDPTPQGPQRKWRKVEEVTDNGVVIVMGSAVARSVVDLEVVEVERGGREVIEKVQTITRTTTREQEPPAAGVDERRVRNGNGTKDGGANTERNVDLTAPDPPFFHPFLPSLPVLHPPPPQVPPTSSTQKAQAKHHIIFLAHLRLCTSIVRPKNDSSKPSIWECQSRCGWVKKARDDRGSGGSGDGRSRGAGDLELQVERDGGVAVSGLEGIKQNHNIDKGDLDAHNGLDDDGTCSEGQVDSRNDDKIAAEPPVEGHDENVVDNGEGREGDEHAGDVTAPDIDEEDSDSCSRDHGAENPNINLLARFGLRTSLVRREEHHLQTDQHADTEGLQAALCALQDEIDRDVEVCMFGVGTRREAGFEGGGDEDEYEDDVGAVELEKKQKGKGKRGRRRWQQLSEGDGSQEEGGVDNVGGPRGSDGFLVEDHPRSRFKRARIE
ncbi:hypothetical protein GALMADRAFT_1358733 [Galerina marginata CBS 339.88]|uniref:Uncharacterized protein n=1 Tax=Galerina marginata (strain CBS 339.88) TaxID=685588 RepID=A0A067S8M1_GALM3|nr:hypothetical protein GALMADRAFT_1358733 [Galerina marginata CBS 339.88]